MINVRTMILVILFSVGCCLQVASAAPPQISGTAGLVMNAETGQVLYQQNGDMKLYPASTTKILTGIIALENADLDEIVTVTENAVGVEGTAIGLQKGEKLKMEDLLYALLLSSANDAAVAIAEHVGGSVSGFVRMMNEKAAELGAVNSHFVNPHGLTEPEHVTTARDLAIIARYAMNNEKFREIVSTRNKKINRGIPMEEEPQIWAYNHNKLLWQYDGAIGVKNGYTTAAQQCLVGSARRGDRELIAVVLKSTTPNALYSDTISLLDYGFEQFESRELVGDGQIVTRLTVPHGVKGVLVETKNALIYDVPVDDPEEITREVKPLSGLDAPVKKGDVAGKLAIFYGGREVGQVDLLALEDVPRKITHNWWFWLVLIIAVLLLLRVLLEIQRRRRRYLFAQRRRRW